eukprot:365576-Chlamydomonas_euryale.AAC.3
MSGDTHTCDIPAASHLCALPHQIQAAAATAAQVHRHGGPSARHRGHTPAPRPHALLLAGRPHAQAHWLLLHGHVVPAVP